MVENPSEGVVYLVPFTSYDLLIDRDSISVNLQVNVGYFLGPEYIDILGKGNGSRRSEVDAS